MNLEAYRAVRRAAGLVDRSAEGRLAVRGADRSSWLQGLLTNDVASLAPGTGCYAAWLTPQGRMITDVRVLALPEEMLLDVHGSRVAELSRQLADLVIMEDVQVEDVTSSLARLGVHGPRSAAVLVKVLADVHNAQALARLPEDESRVVRAVQGSAVIVAGSREVGVQGYDLYVSMGDVPTLRAVLEGAGAAPVDAPTWDLLKLEVGRPVFGVDMDEETIPLEAGIESRAISFTKGCYVGQEVLVRVRDRGQGRVAKRLVGLRLADTAVAGRGVVPGSPLLSEGRVVGRVTSAGWSPILERPIALGYVPRDLSAPGTRVDAQSLDAAVELQVVVPPFVPLGS